MMATQVEVDGVSLPLHIAKLTKIQLIKTAAFCLAWDEPVENFCLSVILCVACILLDGICYNLDFCQTENKSGYFSF